MAGRVDCAVISKTAKQQNSKMTNGNLRVAVFFLIVKMQDPIYR